MGRKILNVGADEEQVKARARELSAAGFEVISATNLLEVIASCEQHDVALAVLGHIINVKEKSRIASTIRSCKRGTPVLALYDKSASEADDADAALPATQGSEALVEVVTDLLRSRQEQKDKRRTRRTH